MIQVADFEKMRYAKLCVSWKSLSNKLCLLGAGNKRVEIICTVIGVSRMAQRDQDLAAGDRGPLP